MVVKLIVAKEALAFYRDQWRANAFGDCGEPHLTQTFMEPTEDLLRDGGRRARDALNGEM